jgi:hypothetical protein
MTERLVPGQGTTVKYIQELPNIIIRATAFFAYVGNHPGFDAKSFKGSMYEVLIYNTALSTTDRQTIETYLRSKWGF